MKPNKELDSDLAKEKEYEIKAGVFQKIAPNDWIDCSFGILQVISTDTEEVTVIYNDEAMILSAAYIENVFRRVPR